MDWERAYNDLVANYWPAESQWIFDTSAGAEASFTSPGVKIGIAATGGALWVPRVVTPEAEHASRAPGYVGL
jgi:hypothetical protein